MSSFFSIYCTKETRSKESKRQYNKVHYEERKKAGLLEFLRQQYRDMDPEEKRKLLDEKNARERAKRAAANERSDVISMMTGAADVLRAQARADHDDVDSVGSRANLPVVHVKKPREVKPMTDEERRAYNARKAGQQRARQAERLSEEQARINARRRELYALKKKTEELLKKQRDDAKSS